MPNQVPNHEEVFWLVWEPGGHNPTFRHFSYRNAISEAQRLAERNPGKQFYVVKALEYFEKEHVSHTVLLETEDDMDMPF
jgi:hypothetical protein